MNEYFRVQAHNNAWSNLRLGKACLSLKADEVSQKRTGFFPSLIATLNHILIVDWYYVSALEGQCIGQEAFKSLIPFPDMKQFFAEQREVDQRLVTLCDDPENTKPDRLIHLSRSDKLQTERFDRTFLHLIQHQIHHRGPAHCMLAETSVAPPQLDEFFLAWDEDRKLRAGDLTELGTTEEEIWKGF